LTNGDLQNISSERRSAMNKREMKNGFSVADMFPSRWLRATDIDDELEVQVRHISKEILTGKDGQEEKFVMWFQGLQKGLVLNKTNALKMGEIFGADDYREWANQRIVLYSTQVEAFGETVQAVRIRAVSSESDTDGD
jgi:hypothetical protein